MPVPVASADLSLPRAGDARQEADREIVATIPIRVPLSLTPLSLSPEATSPEPPVPTPPLSDAELLGAFVERRDADAFTEIVQRYRQMVYRVALRAVEDRHLADDVFQATFLVLAQSARKIKSGEVLPAWLHGTARNIARRALSNQHTERQRLAALATQTLAEKGGEMTTSTAVDPFDELVRRHEQQLLDEELQQLPEASRAPLVLYYLEEKSQAEIAQLMGLTVEAVEGRLKRAKQELRARLIRRGVLLSTVVAAATVLTPAITAAAPTASLVSATVTTALGTAALGSTALAATAATGTAASTSLATGATTAAKLAAQEVAAMSAASKATVMFVTTAVSTTVATGLLFGAIAGSLLGGKGVTPAVSTSPVEEFVSPMNIVRDEVGPNPFAWEGEEPVVLALGGPEGEDTATTQPLSSVEDQSVELRQPAERVFLQVTAFDADQETIAKLATQAKGGENLLLPQPGMLEQFKSLRDLGRVRTTTDQTTGVQMGNPGAILGFGEFAVPDAAGNLGMRFRVTEYCLILTPQARNKNDDLSVEYLFDFSERGDPSADAFPEKKIPGLNSRGSRGNATLPGDGNGVLIGPWVKDSAPSGDGNGVTPNRTYIWIRERRFDLGWESYGMRLDEIPRGSESLKRTDFRGGMLIREIRPTSPAERQGIQPGDILVGLNQWETLSSENVMHALKQPDAKTTPLKFYVVRDGKTLHGQMTSDPSTNDAPIFQAPEAPMLDPPAEAISKPLTSPSRRAVHKPSVRDALAEPVDIEIDAMPLSKFLNLLADLPGIGAVGYSPQKSGFDASVRVSISAKGCTWKTVLRALAPAIHPEARFIENGETLMLTRVNRTDMKLSTVAYDISKSTKTRAEVEEFIRTFVDPHQDRKFQMSRVENILVMKTTFYRHLLLEDFLAQPELAADGTPLPEPVIRVTREQDEGAAEAPVEKPGTGDAAE